jgi:hypothetical protein
MTDKDDLNNAAVGWRVISVPRRIALGLPAKSGLPTVDKPKKQKEGPK